MLPPTVSTTRKPTGLVANRDNGAERIRTTFLVAAYGDPAHRCGCRQQLARDLGSLDPKRVPPARCRRVGRDGPLGPVRESNGFETDKDLKAVGQGRAERPQLGNRNDLRRDFDRLTEGD